MVAAWAWASWRKYGLGLTAALVLPSLSLALPPTSSPPPAYGITLWGLFTGGKLDPLSLPPPLLLGLRLWHHTVGAVHWRQA